MDNSLGYAKPMLILGTVIALMNQLGFVFLLFVCGSVLQQFPFEYFGIPLLSLIVAYAPLVLAQIFTLAKANQLQKQCFFFFCTFLCAKTK